MKLLEHAPESAYNDESTIEYKLDREIIKIEHASQSQLYNGYIYAKVTFEPIEGEDFIMTRVYNTPFTLICKFDTEFEGDYWEAE